MIKSDDLIFPPNHDQVYFTSDKINQWTVNDKLSKPDRLRKTCQVSGDEGYSWNGLLQLSDLRRKLIHKVEE